jgi:hypothetical protein
MSQWNSLRANLANLFGDSFVNNRLLESILPGITTRESQSIFFGFKWKNSLGQEQKTKVFTEKPGVVRLRTWDD